MNFIVINACNSSLQFFFSKCRKSSVEVKDKYADNFIFLRKFMGKRFYSIKFTKIKLGYYEVTKLIFKTYSAITKLVFITCRRLWKAPYLQIV